MACRTWPKRVYGLGFLGAKTCRIHGAQLPLALDASGIDPSVPNEFNDRGFRV